jgi:hypothetical protein
LRRAVVTADEFIEEYKIIQTDIKEILVMLKSKADLDRSEQKVKANVRSLWDTLELQHPQVTFQLYDEMPSHIKRKRIESRIKEQNDGRAL